jgi:hypothetical protein
VSSSLTPQSAPSRHPRKITPNPYDYLAAT